MDCYNMSEQQTQLYVAQNIVENHELYTLSFYIKFEGNIDCTSMHRAIQTVFDENEILKSYIINCEDGVKLKMNTQDVKIPYFDTYLPEINDYTKRDAVTLNSNALYKIKFMKIRDGVHVLYFSFHHIVIDGDSIKLFCESLRTAYNTEIAQKASEKLIQPTKVTSINYFDYTLYQSIFRKSTSYRLQKEYYQREFQNQYEYLCFPGKQVEQRQLYNAKAELISFHFDAFLSMQRYALSNKLQVSSLFLAALALLLSNYCNTDDIVIGCVSNGRENNVLLKKVIGFFSNIMALRLKLEPEMILEDFLLYINQKIINAVRNQDFSYGDIVRDMSSYQSNTNKPLIQIVFNMQQSYELTKPWKGISKIDFNLIENDKIIYDLIVDIKYNNDSLIVKFEYPKQLFSDSFIKRMIENYQFILKNILVNTRLPLAKIPCVNLKEQKMLLDNFNKNDQVIQYKNVLDILSESIQRNLDKPAIVENGIYLTYAEVKHRIGCLAPHLLKSQTEKDIVAILMDRSSDYVISLLSVLYTGSGFVPVDPSLPEIMMINMLNDCKVKRILTVKAYKNQVEGLEERIKNISILYIDTVENVEIPFPVPIIAPQDLAYVIFTSGTTGAPKGAMISHENLANLYLLFQYFFQINNANRIMQFSNISFDASIWEIFMAFYHGAALYIPPKKVILDTNEFCEFINENQIDTVTLPPVYARQLTNHALSSIKNFIVAGSVAYCNDYSQLRNKANFYNAYGLTETTVCATVYHANANTFASYHNELPVGKPAPNTKLFILDMWNRITPIGVPGELHIAGKCVSNGYINKESLTEERFIFNRYLCHDKMYRTGDLALWMQDGNIIVTGRNDEQIKVKGIRIELTAIESVYLKHAKIKQFVVIAEKNANDYKLKAFYTANEELMEDDLRTYGSKTLPAYMLPQVFIKLQTMPLSMSGKIDKKLLVSIDMTNEPTHCTHKVENEEIITEQICSIISNLTDCDFSLEDNFFEIGLDSYLLMTFRNEIQKSFQIDIRIVDLFKYTTINSFSNYLKSRLGS